MRKLNFILILILLSLSGYSQILYGPKLGLTMSHWSIDSPSFDNSPDGMKPGLLLGFYLQKQFPSEFFAQFQIDYRTFVGGPVTSSALSGDVGGSNIYIPVTFGSSLSYNIKWHFGAALGIPLEVDDDGYDLYIVQSSGSGGGNVPLDLIVGLNFNFSKVVIDVDYFLGMTAVHYTDQEKWRTGQFVVTLGLNLAAQ